MLGGAAVGTAVGGMIVGPAALLRSPEPPALDFRLSLLRQHLTEAENGALTQRMNTRPDQNHILANILNAKVEEQPGLIRILLAPGEKVNIEIEVIDNAKAGDGTAANVSVQAGQKVPQGTCPADMVYASSVKLCVDEHEFTNPGSVMPKVNVNLVKASALCAAQKVGSGVKRLPTANEWYRIASKGGKQIYSNRIGNEVNIGVHFRAEFARAVCAARGHYIEYDGKEICDMSGNVGEWTADSFISGGWFIYQYPRYVRAVRRYRRDPVIRGSYLGFRCVSSPQDSPKK